MGRRSNIKTIVDGLPLKTFLLHSLVKKAYRALVKDKTFVLKTGIKTIGNFYNISKDLGIDMQEVYSYGVSNNMISKEWSFEKWLEVSRNGQATYKKDTSEIDIIIKIGELVGLHFDQKSNIDTAKELILDFISVEEFNNYYKKTKKKITKTSEEK